MRQRTPHIIVADTLGAQRDLGEVVRRDLDTDDGKARDLGGGAKIFDLVKVDGLSRAVSLPLNSRRARIRTL